MILGPYTVHPVADEFPMIDGDELKKLADDIKTNGLREPIVTDHSGKVLIDGRNRWRACELAGMDPPEYRLPADYTQDMFRDFIVSANIKRRHLNADQLALIGDRLEPFYAQAAKERQGTRTDLDPNIEAQMPQCVRSPQARDLAAAAVGVSGRHISRAKAIRGKSDLIEKVNSKEMTLIAAEKEVRKQDASVPKPKPEKQKPTTLTLYTHEGAEVEYPEPRGKATFNESKGEGISWAAWSWNPVTGCLHGCKYCYAREIANDKRSQTTFPVGFTPLFHHERLDAPANTTIPSTYRNDDHQSCDDGDCRVCAYRRVFVCSMADLYGRWVPDEWIERVHASMLASPQWQYITLTKFPDRYAGLDMPAGAWVGTSIDEQRRVRIAQRAFEKLPDGVIKWLSLEPLLEPLKFDDLSMFDWVVIGAQTQTYQPEGVYPAFAPPFEWVARITEQAKAAGCRVHHKPNLLGRTDSGSPGMQMLNEYPDCS